jgi:hypothetical protein
LTQDRSTISKSAGDARSVHTSGHNQTSAGANGMSAFHPIADIVISGQGDFFNTLGQEQTLS